MNNPVARRALLALSHPLSIAALLILLLNDHWLKKVAPSWLTGKLSDVAGLVFVPFVLLILLACLLPARFRKHERGLGLLTVLIVGGAFALIKTVPAARDAAAQLFENVFGWSIIIRIDPTDLLALPALLTAWHVWKQSAATMLTPKRSWPLLALSTVALVATAPPWVDLGVFCLQHRDQRLIAPTDSGVFVSSDGGLTWEATTGEQIQRSDCAYQYGRSWQLSDPFNFGTHYRFQSAQLIERSVNDGRTWQADFLSPMTESQSVYYSTVRQDRHASELTVTTPGPFDAVFDQTTRNLVVAMGQEGVLVRTPDDKWRYVAIGPYSRIDLSRSHNFLPLLRWEILSAAVLLFLVMAMLAGGASRSWATVFPIAAWIFWAGRLITLPHDSFTISGFDLAIWLGLVFPALVAVPLGIMDAAQVLAVSRRAFGLLLSLAFGAGVLFLIPYWLWSQGSIPQYRTATFFALGLVIILVLTGRQMIGVGSTKSQSE